MKTSYFLAVAFGLTASLGAFAQETASKPALKQVHVKIVKDINGVQTTIDTTLSVEGSAVFLRENAPEGLHEQEKKIMFIGTDGTTQEISGGKTFDIEVTATPGQDRVVFINGDSLKVTVNGAEGSDVHRIRIVQKAGEGSDLQEFNWEGSSEEMPADLTPEMRARIEKMRAERAANGDGPQIIMIERNQEGDAELTEKVIRWNTEGGTLPEDMDPKMKEMIENARKEAAETGGTPGKRILIIEQESADGLPNKTLGTWTDENGHTYQAGDRMEVRIIHFTCNVFEVNDEDAATLKQAGVKKANKPTLEVTDLQFFPNPSNGLFTLKFTSAEQGAANLLVRDLTGKVVLEQAIPEVQGSVEKEIDLTSQARGTYFLSITQGNRQLTKKVVLE